MNKYLVIAVISILTTIAASVLRGYKTAGSPAVNLSDLECIYPVTVSGQAMEPGFKAGTKLILSRCFRDKQNFLPGTVVLFSESGANRLGRIKEKIIREGLVFYKVGRDARPEELFTVSPDNIIASDEK